MLPKKVEKAMQEGDLLQVALLLHNYPKDSDSLGILLLEACRIGFKNIDIFLDQGADVNYACNEFWFTTPLMYACLKSDTDVVNLLINRGADVNMLDGSKGSALHHASTKDNLDNIKLLVEKGAHINVQDSSEYTPLHNACHYGRLEVADFLLSSGADPSILTEYGETASYLAQRHDHPEIVKLLEQHAKKIHGKAFGIS